MAYLTQGLKLHFDSHSLGLSNGASVVQLTNQVSSENHGVQANSNNRATAITGETTANKTAIGLDGTNDFYSFGNLLSAFNEGTIYVLIKITSDTGSYGSWSGYSSENASNSANYFPYSGGTIYDGWGSNARAAIADPTLNLASGYRLVTITAKNGERKWYIDGTEIYSTSSNAVAFPSDFEFGRSRDGVGVYIYLSAKILKILAYNVAHSSSDVEQNKNEFAIEYQLSNLGYTPPLVSGSPASPSFDEVLLNKYYSAFAEGGPEWATDIVRSGLGGAVSVRNANRQNYISKYEVQYRELTKDKLADLRKFVILRNGMARGFRFLAPDDKELVRERVGVLNSGTGEIERLTQTNGSTATFYLVKYYKDDFSSYLRRIVKPSPLDGFKVEIANSTAPDTITDSFTLSATSGNILPDIKTGTLSTISKTVEVDFYRGKLTFDSAPAANLIIYVTATYHLPVFFSTDWHKVRVDETAISDFSIGVEEALPAELGLV